MATTLQEGATDLQASIDVHKELYWAGIISARVDCCANGLYLPEEQGVRQVFELIKEWGNEAKFQDEKRLYSSEHDAVLYLLKLLEPAGREVSGPMRYKYAEYVYKHYFHVVRSAADALQRYYHAKTGLYGSHETKSFERQHQCWTKIRDHLALVVCELIENDSVYHWRMKAFKTWPHAYGAYILKLNHFEEATTPYSWFPSEEVKELSRHYETMLRAEPEGALTPAGDIYSIMIAIVQSLWVEEDMMSELHSAIWTIADVITPCLEHEVMNVATEAERLKLFHFKQLYKTILGFTVKRG